MATDVFKLSLHVNILGKGFNESYIVPGNDYASALTVARNICLFRRGFFGLGCVMEWASISKLGFEREARAAINAPLGPHPRMQEKISQANADDWWPNNPDDSLVYRFETADGKWSNRFLRGVPDHDLTKFNLRAGMLPYNPFPVGSTSIVPATDTDASLAVYCASALSYFRDNTLWHREILPETNPRSWNVANWVSVVFRKVGDHKTGRPFGLSAGRRL